MATGELYSIILALLTAAVSGLVGAFALMKRMVLAGDVISHIALPGLGLAILYGVNPLIGGAATLFLGIILIWRLQGATTLTVETAIGVIFIASVAIGALITPGEELIEALFGGFEAMGAGSFAVGVVAVILIAAFIAKFKNRLVLDLFSPELAASAGLNLSRLNLYYLLIFGLTILLGLRFLGAVLVGALIIVPAAIGRQLTHTLTAFLLASALAGVASVALGLFIASRYGLELGPTVVVVASFLFLLALLKKKR
ncbi:metal ABC transporter permease [Candidatus Parcubacteria bacterium]|nr:MAG: metal ABC transporter permease [Candidatus Parcubacteria bacterium]